MENTNKQISEGIAKSAEKALEFIEKIVASPIMEGTGIITDKIQYWRFQNKVNTVLRAIEFLKSKGIELPHKIPVKDLSTLLDLASYEENKVMQDNWARLLAKTIAEDNVFNSCHLFSHVLNQISVNEYYILKYAKSRSYFRSDQHRAYININELIKNSHSDYSIGVLLIDNLLRLRLIEEEPPKLKNPNYSPFIDNHDKTDNSGNSIVASNNYRLSKFGEELLKKIDE